jgi:acetyltransferase-like isoleucine patch superfamily enzyme
MSSARTSIWKRLRNLGSALRLFSDPLFVRELGERANQLAALDVLRRANPTCCIDSEVIFHDLPLRTLTLGQSVRISRGTVIGSQPLADESPLILIGNDTYLGEYVNIRTAPRTHVSIGSNVLIAQFCSIVSANHATRTGGDVVSQGIDMTRHSVRIEDGVWLGAGTTVLPGVSIGRGAVVGANSVVNTDVPADEIWVGSPARRIGNRRSG